MSGWILAQVVVDVLFLILLLSVLRSRGREQERASKRTTETADRVERSSAQLHRANLEELRATLESLVERVESTVGESLVSLDDLIARADTSKAKLSDVTLRAEKALGTLNSAGARDVVSPEHSAEAPALSAETQSPTTHAREILRMREHGAKVDEIAKALSIGRGEVHLVLDMNRVGQGK